MVQVVPGAEAWSAQGGDVGVLVLHGYTGNPVSMRPLAESLADRGFAVELPRLPGHGTTWQELAKTTWRDWAREAVTALEALKERTRTQAVVGLSGGGTLALYLAQTRHDDVAGLALINPSVWTGHKLFPLLPYLRWVVPSFPAIGNDIAKPDADEVPYPRNPLKSMHSLSQLWGLVRADLHRVTQPVLVFTSRQDHIVEPENSRMILEGVASSDTEQVWLERSYHVATLDHDAGLIQERTAEFVERVASGGGT